MIRGLIPPRFEYNYYYPLDDKTVLAFDNYAVCLGDVPWDQVFPPSVTGGRCAAIMTAAIRIIMSLPHRWSTGKLDWRHGIVLWAGGGTMSESARHLGGGHWLPNVGVGYRFEFKPRMNVRLDFGVGKQSSGFISVETF